LARKIVLFGCRKCKRISDNKTIHNFVDHKIVDHKFVN
jgi:hypothetical protein